MAINININLKTTAEAEHDDEEMPPVQSGTSRPNRARDVQVFIPGDTVMSNAEGWMDGHGLYCTVLPDKQVQMFASVAGVRQVFTRVVVINPIKSRYSGEIGDIVVGRIIQVGRKSWSVDVGAHSHAVLNLGAINLPSGELRRKTEEDIGFMRGYLKEGDLVSAEVQKQGADGRLLIHTRSTRYGRLVHGMLLKVQPKLTKRGKGHFVSYDTFGVHLIVGVNGAIWIAPTQRQMNIPLGLDQGEQLRKVDSSDYPEEEKFYVPLTDEQAEKFGAKNDTQGYIESQAVKTPSIASLEVRKCMARIRNCIEILNTKNVPIHRETIRILYDISGRYEPKDLLQPTVAKEIFDIAQQELAPELPGVN